CATRWIGPEPQSVATTTQIASGSDNSAVDAVFKDFAKAVGARCNYRHSAGERFKTGIRKWIVNRRQNEDVRSRVTTHNVCNFAEKLHQLLPPKAQACRFVELFISAAGNEQTHFSVLAERHGLDRKE